MRLFLTTKKTKEKRDFLSVLKKVVSLQKGKNATSAYTAKQNKKS